jgi:hypothetical protein
VHAVGWIPYLTEPEPCHRQILMNVSLLVFSVSSWRA